MAESAKDWVSRAERLEADRGNWDQTFQEIADVLLPRRNNIVVRNSRGAKRNQKQYSSVGMHAHEVLAASLHGTLTSSALRWFDLSTGDDALDRRRAVNTWLLDTATRIWKQLNSSNFHSQIHEVYLDITGFGTCCILEEQVPASQRLLNFNSFPIEAFLIEENHVGAVDALCLKHKLTGRQAVQKYGARNVHSKIKRAMEKDPTHRFDFLQWILPRDEREPDKVDAANMPFASIHVDREHQMLLRNGGYPEQPFAVARWSKSAGETYGRGPGDAALPDIKVLNEATRLELNAWAKAIDPPFLFTNDGVIGGKVNLRPGKGTCVEDLEKSLKPFESKARWDVNRIKLDEYRTAIRQAFFADQLELPRQGPEMTATEIQVRWELMQRVLGPTLGRLERELLDQIIARTFNIMLRERRLAAPPPEIAELGEIQVIYTGPLARAQKQQDIAAADRWLERIIAVAQASPEVVDNADFDEFSRWLHENSNLPARLLRNARTVQQLRQQRQRQQQALASVAAAEGAAGAAKDMAAAQRQAA